MENQKDCICGPDCECGAQKCGCSHKKPALVLISIGLVMVGAVLIISLLRERIVNPMRNQITVYGEGKVSSAPDTAKVTLGARVDKAATAEAALGELNSKVEKITEAILALGVSKEDIKTENYSLSPAVDFIEGVSKTAGYNASQTMVIKIREADKNSDLVNKVVATAGSAGSNDIQGVNYYIENSQDLKQKARMMAIEDARKKAVGLAKAAGIKKLGKVSGWYEEQPVTPFGFGGNDAAAGMGESKNASRPVITPGTQEIVVNLGVNFEIK